MRLVTHGKRRRTPEAQLQAAIVKFLRAIGAMVAVTDPGVLRSRITNRTTGIPNGWPDLTVLLPGGRMVGIEVKAPKGRQTPSQAQMQNDWQRLGHEYILARSMDDVIDALENDDAWRPR